MRALPAAAAVAAVALGIQMLDVASTSAGSEVATLTNISGAVSVLAGNGPAGTPEVTDSVRAGDVIRTTDDGSASLTLANGVIVRVNTNTELLVAALDRIELRQGTAYVDSGPEPDSAGLLMLDTPFGTLRHIGTQYETRVGTNNLRIRVREGTVRYTTETPTGETVETLGTAGEQLLAMRDNDEIRRSSVALTGPEWSWVENLATSPAGDVHSLDELLQWIARETGRELRFASDTVASNARSETIVGAGGLSPEETLDVIARSTGFDLDIGDAELVVR
jgi:ferric-dicitrate binding protein FerR (iron transport regulator)